MSREEPWEQCHSKAPLTSHSLCCLNVNMSLGKAAFPQGESCSKWKNRGKKQQEDSELKRQGKWKSEVQETMGEMEGVSLVKKGNGDELPPPFSTSTLSSHRHTVNLMWRSRGEAAHRLCSGEGNSSVLSTCCLINDLNSGAHTQTHRMSAVSQF